MNDSQRYRDALNWLYSFSDTERTGAFVRDREDNLARERALLAALGDPQRAYGVTHIAGTKGKGSTAAMVATILRAAGLRAGLYSQPDLHTFRERLRVDGAVAGEAEVARLAPVVRDALASVDPRLGPYITYEVATALAFLFFRDAGVEQAVIEVGLGGRLDATNVVEPLVSAITSISYDHMNVLGDTLAAIAGEKAGIVKPGTPVVTSARAPEALAVIAEVCAERAAPLWRVGPAGAADCAYTYAPGPFDSERQFFDVTTPSGVYRNLELSLLGEHQIENATTALALAEQLRARGLSLDEAAIREGLRGARWPARLQVVGREPWRIVDGAHNADSFEKLFAALRRHFPYQRLILVLGLMADKDVRGIAEAVGRAAPARVLATAIDYPRAVKAAPLATLLREVAPHLHISEVESLGPALAAAVEEAGPRDLVCVSGSLYTAGAALRWFAARPDTLPGSVEIAGVDH